MLWLNMESYRFKISILFSILLVKNVVTAPADDPTLELIAAAARKIDESSFADDLQLIQKVDKVNSISTYRNAEADPEKEGHTVFYRHANDAGKPVVVLSGSEDFLRHTSTKGVYVVLRQSSADPKVYRVFYAYLRNKMKEDEPSSLVTVNGKQKRIEFDIWDHRGGSRNSNRAFGWTTCDNTLVTICKKHSQEKALEIAEYDTTDIEAEKGSQVPGSVAPKAVLAKTNMKGVDGDDANANYDFFWDLDNPADESQAVGKIVAAHVYEEATISRAVVVAAAAIPAMLGEAAEKAGMGRSISNMANELSNAIPADSFRSAAVGTEKGIELIKEVIKPKRSVGQYTPAIESETNSMIEKRGAVLGAVLGGLSGVVDGLTSTLGLGTVDDLVGGLLGTGGSGGGGGLLGLGSLLGTSSSGLVGGLLGGLGAIAGGGRSVEGVNAASKDMDTDMFEKFGWFTQDTATADLDHNDDHFDKVVFMGFGTCPWTSPQPSDFLQSTSVETTALFILRVLRTQCGEELQAGIKEIVKSNCAELKADKSIGMSTECSLRSKSKLTKKETSILSRLYALESLTRRYVFLAGGAKADPKTPTGIIIGSKIFGFGTGILQGLEVVTGNYVNHCVMLSRNRAFTTKFAFVKLLQDYFRVKACPACGRSVQQAYDNLVYLNGIIQFIYAGLGRVQAGEPVGLAFDKFYILNKDLIQEGVDAYLKV